MARQQFLSEEGGWVNPSQRYDSEAVREILARAAELEQADQEALTAAQIEELGRELGLQPGAIRRAMGERETTRRVRGSTTSSWPTNKAIGRALQPGMYVAATISLLFFILTKVYPSTLPTAWIVIILFCVCGLPLIGGFLNGWRERDWRLGAISSGVGTVLMFAGVVGATMIGTGNTNMPPPAMCLMALGIVVAAAICGALGAIAEKRVHEVPVKAHIASDR